MSTNHTTTTATDARVQAIRHDETVGRGTCTSIDECYTDAELAAELDKRDIDTPAAAVRWARRHESIWQEVADDVRATAW
jgi:hypothetical protein